MAETELKDTLNTINVFLATVQTTDEEAQDPVFGIVADYVEAEKDDSLGVVAVQNALSNTAWSDLDKSGGMNDLQRRMAEAGRYRACELLLHALMS